jgi:heat shock protein HslJ
MSPVNAKRVLLSAGIALGALVLAACGGNSANSESTTAAATSAPAASSALPTSAAPTAGASAATSTAGLADTTWNLTAYTDAKGAEVPGTTGANVGTLNFAADGSFSGSTGCNRLVGQYTQNGSSLTMTPGPMTKMACPADVTAQENAILAALPKVASFTSGTALVLTAADGATLLTYSAGTATLAGTSWTATGINNGKGAVVAQAGTDNVTIDFGTDGTVSGSSGCNTYNGNYTADAGTISFGPLAQTMKACEDAIMQIEQQYTAALAASTVYQLEGSTLTLRDASGATQVTFAQSQ